VEHPERPRYALDVIRSWPDVARQAAHQVLMVHRAPSVVEDDSLCWTGIGPWKRVLVRAGSSGADPDVVLESVIESVVEAEIPADRRADVATVASEFRVDVEDDGEIVVRGRDLASNVITLNVLHALVDRELSVDAARERRAVDLAALRAGRPSPGAETLRFAGDAPCGEPRLLNARRSASYAAGAGTDAS
jgi:hypothetical protein